MKITTERRIRLAQEKIARLQAKIAELRASDPDSPVPLRPAAVDHDVQVPTGSAPMKTGWIKKDGMVDAVIEHRAVQLFGGDTWTPMIVREDRGESFAAECLRGELPGGGRFMAFLKSEKNRMWR